MAKCPNCGRETKRTEDWCCQWCGYPLLSGSYKKIPKTYRELREERLPQQLVVEEAELEEELEPEVEDELEEVAEFEEEVEPEEELELEEVAELEEEVEPEPEPKPKPRVRRRPAARRKPVAKTEPTPVAEPAPKPVTRRKAAARPKAAPEVEAEPESAAMEITVEELLSAYATEGEAADARFSNQILRITGVVDRVEVKVALDIYYITLTGAEANSLENVRCTFDRTQGPELEQLTAGQTVTVQGRYDGSIIDISMRDCFLVH